MYAPNEEVAQVVDANKSKRVAGGMLKEKKCQEDEIK